MDADTSSSKKKKRRRFLHGAAVVAAPPSTETTIGSTAGTPLDEPPADNSSRDVDVDVDHNDVDVHNNDDDNDNDDDDDDTANSDPPNVLPESTAYWSKPNYAWSSSFDYIPPRLTSSRCAQALYDLFHNTYYDATVNDPNIPNFLLSVVVESSSHPSGLHALVAQPYVYGGGGLGNLDECPLQSCVVGSGQTTDSFIFASICIVPECSAYDIAAEDFTSVAARQLIQPHDYPTAAPMIESTLLRTTNKVQPQPPPFANDDDSLAESKRLGRDYLQLLQTIGTMNIFLNGGWTCGNFVVPWTLLDRSYAAVLFVSVAVLPPYVWWLRRRRQRQRRSGRCSSSGRPESHHHHQDHRHHDDDDHAATTRIGTSTRCAVTTTSCPRLDTTATTFDDNDHHHNDYGATSERALIIVKTVGSDDDDDDPLIPQKSIETVLPTKDDEEDWTAVWDLSRHLQSLVAPSRISSIDGLRVGSMVWIILGHVMAIQSSMGAGYANPSNFLPPTGWTTTVIGQLLFSCRYAVDTFLILSGYLVVTVLNGKVQWTAHNRSVVSFYCRQLPGLLLGRVVRILPLYATTLGMYTLLAPHLGSGPFWHLWLALLKPCHDYGWTNLLFVNNFWPPDTPTTATCFYHSWYIAVDLQLFAVAPLFVFWFQKNAMHAMRAVLLLFVTLVLLSAYLGHTNHWSFNTFDGSAVARFDVEAYAKPHIRAPAYLAGMFTAMVQILDRRTVVQQRPQRMPSFVFTWRHHALLYASLCVMAAIAFCTVLGAYARRPCGYREDPFHNECGSLWSERTTWLYTTFGRPLWSIAVAIVLAHTTTTVVEQRQEEGGGYGGGCCIVTTILSWPCWAPLSRLTFGAYLVHPIIIFVWQLGDREKTVFRFLTFAMNYLSVCCVSYIMAFVLSLTIELPCAALWKYITTWTSKRRRRRPQHRHRAPQNAKRNGHASSEHLASYGTND